jgi:hypothetical protein
MRKIALSIAILGATLLMALYTAPAQAQATRTWVSGVGDDANPFSRTAPCKTFAGAISKTATGGQIDCLDPGGFGALTITKSITIDCHAVFGSTLVAATNGITINAAGAVVTLRNVNIDGLLQTATPGLIGLSIVAAKTVFVEDVLIEGFLTKGLCDSRTAGGTGLFVRNTVIRNNARPGISLTATATNNVVLENVHSVSGTFGLATATGNNVLVSRSVMSGNSSAGIEADPGARVLVDNSEITADGIGVQSFGTISLGNSDIAFNTTGISGATTSFGNNRILANTSAGTAPTLGTATTDHGQE